MRDGWGRHSFRFSFDFDVSSGRGSILSFKSCFTSHLTPPCFLELTSNLHCLQIVNYSLLLLFDPIFLG